MAHQTELIVWLADYNTRAKNPEFETLYVKNVCYEVSAHLFSIWKSHQLTVYYICCRTAWQWVDCIIHIRTLNTTALVTWWDRRLLLHSVYSLCRVTVNCGQTLLLRCWQLNQLTHPAATLPAMQRYRSLWYVILSPGLLNFGTILLQRSFLRPVTCRYSRRMSMDSVLSATSVVIYLYLHVS